MKRNLSFAGLVAVVLALAALRASAVDYKTLEAYGAQRTYSARASATSSHTVVGLLLSWSVTSIGGATDFEVKHSTVAADQNVNVSSTIYVLAGQSVSDSGVGQVKNPLIWISRIDTPGTTAYVDITYLAPRGGGTP